MNRFPGHNILPYAMIFPTVAVIAVFLVVPFIQAIQMSFYRISPFGRTRVYTGWRNFQELLTSPEYLASLLNTLLFCSLVIGIGLGVSLFIAVLATQKIRGAAFYQIAFIWTYAMSPAIAGVIWALMFDPSVGIMTALLETVTGYRLNFFTDAAGAFLLVTIASIWVMLGYNITFYIAGLQNVPFELKEAALVDGAGPIKAFWIITFPMLSPTTAFLIFVNTLYAFFMVFGMLDVVTQGGPGQTTEFLVYKIYRDGFARLREGQAAAQSVFLFLMVASIAGFQIYSSTRRAVYGR
ncbi:MAG: sugar ABC transporter permease [Trueperaceae bacterium]